MRYPTKTTSALFPLWLRGDLPREAASAYWAGPHADIVRRVPGLIEYVRRHFSTSDHGFWPSAQGVGTLIPESTDRRYHGAVVFERSVPVIQMGPVTVARESVSRDRG